MNLGLTSTEFVVLLPIVVFIYYLFPSGIRTYFLLLINLLFYASFGWRSLFVILSEAVIVWVYSLYAGRESCPARVDMADNWVEKLFVSACVTLLIGLLLFFKGGSMFASSIVAPLGISFFTLQAISYVVDVKERVINSEKSIIKLITYLSFFPTITSGPIYRYKDFAVEYNRNLSDLKPDYDRIINGIIYLLYGYFLKLVISTRCGITVDKVFGDYREMHYGGVILIIVAMLYSVQIYTDFAGYSAIVIGIAQILGYKIPENFIAPYLSMSVKEFWGRWHISLSSWLKDYIYIPLGGNRKGKIRKYINILITFIVSGLWHGINGWHFLVWGAIHGIYQIFGDLTRKAREKVLPNIGIVNGTCFHRTIKRIITFILVTIAWIFFRTGVSDAIHYLIKLVSSYRLIEILNGGLLSIGLNAGDWVILVASLFVVSVVDVVQYNKNKRFDELVVSQGSLAKCLIVVVISLTILIFGVYGDQHDASYFIYRDF